MLPWFIWGYTNELSTTVLLIWVKGKYLSVWKEDYLPNMAKLSQTLFLTIYHATYICAFHFSYINIFVNLCFSHLPTILHYEKKSWCIIVLCPKSIRKRKKKKPTLSFYIYVRIHFFPFWHHIKTFYSLGVTFFGGISVKNFMFRIYRIDIFVLSKKKYTVSSLF